MERGVYGRGAGKEFPWKGEPKKGSFRGVRKAVVLIRSSPNSEGASLKNLGVAGTQESKGVLGMFLH